MFGMGMPEIILILAIALIVLGPKKLPEIAKALGRGIAEFKKATQDFKESLDVEDDLKEARETMREIKGDIQQTVRNSVAKGTASVDSDDESDEDNDAMPAKHLEPPSEKAVEKTPQEPVEGRLPLQAQKKAEEKEPSKDA
jgi:sec-independent protein translocase protein TatB